MLDTTRVANSIAAAEEDDIFFAGVVVSKIKRRSSFRALRKGVKQLFPFALSKTTKTRSCLKRSNSNCSPSSITSSASERTLRSTSYRSSKTTKKRVRFDDMDQIIPHEAREDQNISSYWSKSDTHKAVSELRRLSVGLLPAHRQAKEANPVMTYVRASTDYYFAVVFPTLFESYRRGAERPSQTTGLSLALLESQLIEGLARGYRGVEQHTTVGRHRRDHRSAVLQEILSKQRDLRVQHAPEIITPSSSTSSLLSSSSSSSVAIEIEEQLGVLARKLSKPSNTWALIMAQADARAAQEVYSGK